MNPQAVIILNNKEEIRLELWPQLAPNTVNSFLWLAGQKLFDNHAIQRIVPGSWVDVSFSAFHQAECKYLIANEAPGQNLDIGLGQICMGGYGADGIAGGEFFFPLADCPQLKGKYPVFGQVLTGVEVLRRLERVPLEPIPYPGQPDVPANRPLTPEIITRVELETCGHTYPAPVKLPVQKLPPNWLE